MSNKKRCLWLMNRKTVRNFEAPMLIDMGFEIFCPKLIPYNEDFFESDITYDYDVTLSLPKNALEKLNSENLYENISSEIMELFNQYFDIVFCSFYPKQLKMLVEGFQGVIVLQVDGLKNNKTYTEVIADSLGLSFFDKIENLGERFILGQAHEKIAEVECRVLKNRALYLPVGVEDAYVKDDWIGDDKRIYFICPNINMSSYYKKNYDDFKKDFIGFDYLVGGTQAIEVKNDDNVIGNVSEELYQYNMKHLTAMFCYSREKRHLPYHSLNAVKSGMPLIFMAGGILDELGGTSLSGCCKTIKEARKKLKRIIEGDQKFIDKVRLQQKILLERFTYEYCWQVWSSHILYIEKQIEFAIQKKLKSEVEKKKLAVICPKENLGENREFIIRFLKSMKYGIDESHANIELVFGHLEDVIDKDFLREVKSMGVQVRKFRWRNLSAKDIKSIYQLKGYDIKVKKNKYCVADDGINFFEDCNHLIFTMAWTPKYFFSNTPYSVFVHSYIQRYIPSLLKEKNEKKIFELQRNADAVFVMSSAIKADCIQYCGITQDRIKLLPSFLDLPSSKIEKTYKEDYFLCSTDFLNYECCKAFFEGLELYYKNGGRFKCYIVGTESIGLENAAAHEQLFDYEEEVRAFVAESKILSSNVYFKKNLIREEYYSVLKKAKFIFYLGKDTEIQEIVLDAFLSGIPCMLGDWLTTYNIQDGTNFGVRFAKIFEDKALARELQKAEVGYCEWKEQLPSKADAEKLLLKYMYQRIYEKIKQVAGY